MGRGGSYLCGIVTDARDAADRFFGRTGGTQQGNPE